MRYSVLLGHMVPYGGAGGYMSTQAKREGNRRHLSKFSTRSVRIPAAAAPAIDQELHRRGLSFNGYVLRLIEADTGIILRRQEEDQED